MTFIALALRPRHRLFVNPCRGAGRIPPGGMAGEKKQTVASPGRAGPVLACSNASVLGYRSNNRSREM